MNQSFDASLRDLQRFYAILDQIEARNGGMFRLDECKQSDLDHARGVYFFFQDGECRSRSGRGRRVVRVGIHGQKPGGKSTLWKRLSHHWGPLKGGGNHRTSKFRWHVGVALMEAGLVGTVSGWENKKPPDLSAQRKIEHAVEVEVSRVIRSMSFLWLQVIDDPGKDIQPKDIEQNTIALLTTDAAKDLDPPSCTWLGRHSTNKKLRTSGLWNVDHIGGTVDSMFLDEFERVAQRLKPSGRLS